MAENMIAIDFGTSRTKVAYFNPPEMQRPDLMQLGKELSIPSHFNIDEESGKVWIGDAARERLEDNPIGHITMLKSQLRSVRLGKHSMKPEELLTRLFTEIREIAGRAIACFNGVSPTAVQLTFTRNMGRETTILSTAAKAAGFETVDLIAEPEAAARAWLVTTPNPDSQSREVIVLDCGGGTVDWNYLQRTEDGRFKQKDTLPSGALDIGGEDVDEALVGLVVRDLPQEDVPNRMDVLRTHCQVLKERYCRGLPLPLIKIEKDSHPVEVKLEGSQIQEVIDNTFINPVCDAFKPYLDKVKEETDQDDPVILLVGGSAHLKGLAEGLERALSCRTFSWDRAEFAPVLGAALPVRMEQPALAPGGEDGQPEEAGHTETVEAGHTETVYALTKPNVLQVAETFLTLAAENDERSADVIRETLEDYNSEVFRLVMMGQIKKGKSSLINALLGEWELLPVEMEVSTSTVYEVGYGDTPRYTVVFNPMAALDAAIPGEEVPPRKEKKIDAAEIATYGTETGNPGNEKEVDFIRVQLPHPLLKDGVTLIDTPGLGGTYAQHDEITLRYAPNADAVCFVLDSVEAVVSRPELDGFSKFLEVSEKIGVSRPPFFFVQTKMDANLAWEAFRAHNLRSLSAHFDMPQDALRYFPVSADWKHRATATLSANSFSLRLLENSGFSALDNFFREELLREKEERSARKLLGQILAETEAIYQKIAGELQLFQKTSSAELEELARQAIDNESGFATWEQETYPQLVKDFNTRADGLRQDTLAQLKTALDAEETGPIVDPIIDALRSQELSRKELAEKSDALQQECVAKCQEVTLSILEQYQKKMRASLERTTAELGSSLEDVLIFPAISLTPHEGEGIADSTSFGEKVGAVGSAAGGAIAGDILGGFLIKAPIAMVLGTVVGVGALTSAIVLLPINLVAMAFGGRFALRKFRKGRQEAALSEVRRFLSEVVQHARTQLLQQFEESSKDIEDKVRDRLDSAKTSTVKDLASRRDSIADAQQQTLEENQQTAAELDATLGQVAALLQRIKQMLGTETRANAMSNTP